jgi:hypothetical protein
MSKTTYIAEGLYTYETTDTFAREFKITMNSELVAINSSIEFEAWFGKAFCGRTRYWLHRRLHAGCRTR